MSVEQFIAGKLNAKSQELVDHVNEVLERYRAMGYTLTLRQVYYQLVARNIIPNSEKSYDNLGALINKGRLMGLIDWSMIVDRTREVHTPSHWQRPASILQTVVEAFRIDKWVDQPNHVRVMVEKQALEGILIPVCQDLDIQFSANRGYSSSSALWAMGRELRSLRHRGKAIHILYLGDHDPSGIDMTRDIEDRMDQFSRGPVTVHRLALNMDQIEQYNPPENPAKITDSRARDYISRFGESSWELDALPPDVLANLVIEAVAELRSDDLYRARQRQEARMRIELKQFVATAGTKTAKDYEDPAEYESMQFGPEEEGLYESDDSCEDDCHDLNTDEEETDEE